MNPSTGALPRAVLDSNVIYSRVLYELMGRLAHDARLFDLIWSDALIAEAKRVLIEAKRLDASVAERWVGYLRTAFQGLPASSARGVRGRGAQPGRVALGRG